MTNKKLIETLVWSLVGGLVGFAVVFSFSTHREAGEASTELITAQREQIEIRKAIMEGQKAEIELLAVEAEGDGDLIEKQNQIIQLREVEIKILLDAIDRLGEFQAERCPTSPTVRRKKSGTLKQKDFKHDS